MKCVFTESKSFAAVSTAYFGALMTNGIDLRLAGVGYKSYVVFKSPPRTN